MINIFDLSLALMELLAIRLSLATRLSSQASKSQIVSRLRTGNYFYFVKYGK